MTPVSRPRIAVLTTGGTIASRVGADGVSTTAPHDPDLLDPAALGVSIELFEVLSVDSAAMTTADMDTVADAVRDRLRDDDITGVVVLHGTDSLEETALLVDLSHTDPRPVVFTGAQRTADHPHSDGPHNIACAVRVACDPASRERGVLVAFGPRVLRARGLRKSHTTDLDAYTGVPATAATERVVSAPYAIGGVRVDIVALYPGVDGEVLDFLRERGTRGIVLEALGAGNTNEAVAAAVERCTEHGVAVVLSTRVPAGGVVTTYGGGGGGADLVRAGAISAGPLAPGQARILLAALLSESDDGVAGRFARYSIGGSPNGVVNGGTNKGVASPECLRS